MIGTTAGPKRGQAAVRLRLPFGGANSNKPDFKEVRLVEMS